MPNWVENVIIVPNKSEFINLLINSEGRVDFNIIMPEPETEEECITKYGEQYIDDGNKHLDHSNGKDWFDWWQWHIDFWGTKWNACDSDVREDTEFTYISFSTAWSDPYVIIDKLIDTKLPFIHYWIEEQGFGECSAYADGKKVQLSSFDAWGPIARMIEDFQQLKKSERY